MKKLSLLFILAFAACDIPKANNAPFAFINVVELELKSKSFEGASNQNLKMHGSL